MYLQEIVEVILGLVFAWFVLSLATMNVQEWLAGRLGWRSGDLRKAIQRMLGDESLADLFYDQPLISSLSDFGEGKKKSDPSYIPADKFALALIDIIENSRTESSLFLHGLYSLRRGLGSIRSKARRAEAGEHLSRLIELARLSMNTESGRAFGNLVLASLEKEVVSFGTHYPECEPAVRAMIEEVRTGKDGIDKLVASVSAREGKGGRPSPLLSGILALSATHPKLNLVLNSLLVGIDNVSETAETFLSTFQSNLEKWFNDTMARLSGSYKRRTQVSAFFIGLLIALLLNVDTVRISTQLWREPILRQAVLSNIDQYIAQTGPEGTPDLAQVAQFQLDELVFPIGWKFERVDASALGGCAFAPRDGSAFAIPWWGGCVRPLEAGASADGWLWLLVKLLGVTMSGLAATQGSSFWFDMLMKIVNVRSTGARPPQG
jgi:hypothetical protein